MNARHRNTLTLSHSYLDQQDVVLNTLRKKRLARMNFRKIIRLVIANYFWISEIGHEEQLSFNVMKNVEIVLRRRFDTENYFSLKVKVILYKNPKHRTLTEQTLLDKIIARLKFVRDYDQNIKRKLAAVARFAYYGPGRVLLRQNQPVQAVYYIIRGNVIAKRQILVNETLQEYETQSFIFKAGSVLGDTMMFEQSVHMSTVVTNDHCEFLVIPMRDYSRILRVHTLEKWAYIKSILKHFPHFDRFDEFAIKDVCVFGLIKKYAADSLVMGDGIGKYNTYFIVNGSCRVLEDLLVYKVPDRYNIGYAYKLYTDEEENQHRKNPESLDEISPYDALRVQQRRSTTMP